MVNVIEPKDKWNILIPVTELSNEVCPELSFPANIWWCNKLKGECNKKHCPLKNGL